uniref:Transposase n=1 Tax=Heterorhabditis bacteriophora TaxID=37862 RepID=A0A1I7X6H5_HETBA
MSPAHHGANNHRFIHYDSHRCRDLHHQLKNQIAQFYPEFLSDAHCILTGN